MSDKVVRRAILLAHQTLDLIEEYREIRKESLTDGIKKLASKVTSSSKVNYTAKRDVIDQLEDDLKWILRQNELDLKGIRGKDEKSALIVKKDLKMDPKNQKEFIVNISEKIKTAYWDYKELENESILLKDTRKKKNDQGMDVTLATELWKIVVTFDLMEQENRIGKHQSSCCVLL